MCGGEWWVRYSLGLRGSVDVSGLLNDDRLCYSKCIHVADNVGREHDLVFTQRVVVGHQLVL